MANVVVYTTATCGYCHAAKRLLVAKGVSYEEIDVGGRPDLRSWLVQVSNQRTVPQVFINGRPIGGYSELARMEQRGKLDERLAVTPSVDNPTLRS